MQAYSSINIEFILHVTAYFMIRLNSFQIALIENVEALNYPFRF